MALPNTLSGLAVIAVQQANQVPLPPPGREYIFRDAADLNVYVKLSNGSILPLAASILHFTDTFVTNDWIDQDEGGPWILTVECPFDNILGFTFIDALNEVRAVGSNATNYTPKIIGNTITIGTGDEPSRVVGQLRIWGYK